MTSVTSPAHGTGQPERTLEPQWAEVLSVQQEISMLRPLSCASRSDRAEQLPLQARAVQHALSAGLWGGRYLD